MQRAWTRRSIDTMLLETVEAIMARNCGVGVGLEFEHVFDALFMVGLERDHLRLSSRLAILKPRSYRRGVEKDSVVVTEKAPMLRLQDCFLRKILLQAIIC